MGCRLSLPESISARPGPDAGPPSGTGRGTRASEPAERANRELPSESRSQLGPVPNARPPARTGCGARTLIAGRADRALPTDAPTQPPPAPPTGVLSWPPTSPPLPTSGASDALALLS